jgi:hypothetical protein
MPAELVLMEGIRMIDEWPILEKKIPNFEVVFERAAAAAGPAGRGGRPAKAEIEELMAMVDDGSEPSPAGGGGEPGEGLGPRESAVLALVDGVRTVQEIIDVGQLGEFETCKVLYGLISLGLFRQRAVAAPPRQAPRPAPAASADAGAGAALGAREYAILAAAALLVLAAFLFNPWGIVAQGFRARESRREAAAIADAARLRRVRLALEVHYLEKQAYPADLAKLAESGLLRPRELRAADGSVFSYRPGEREYRLERGEAGR